MISLSRFFALGAVAVAGAAVSSVPAFAQTPTYTFAQYGQQTSVQAFSLTNNGPTSTITASAQVRFFFLPNTSYPQTAGLPTDTFNATMTFTASNPLAPATGSNTPGVTITERFSTYSFMFIDNGVGNRNLLSGSGKNLLLSGTYSDGSSVLNVSTPPAGDVLYTSDFVDFSTSTDRNFGISLSSVVPVLVIDTTNPNPAFNGYVRSFTAASTGTFASNFNNPPPPVPEPGMVTFALTGGAGIMGMVIRGRRRLSSKKSA